MRQVKLDTLNTVEQNIFSLIRDGDEILYEFAVFPYDHNIMDYNSPMFYVTNWNLFFVYDEVIEVHDLAGLDLDIYGEAPKFTLWQQWFEGKFYYIRGQEARLRSLKEAEFYSHLAMSSPNSVPKEFAVRENINIGKAYQSWAMSQLIINVKNRITRDERVVELLNGFFSKFNVKTVGVFIVVFVVYFLLRMLVGDFSDIIGTVLDVVFGIVVVLMGAWTYSSGNKNLKRYEAVYNAYSTEKMRIESGEKNAPVVTTPTSQNAQTKQDIESAQIVAALNRVGGPVTTNVVQKPIVSAPAASRLQESQPILTPQPRPVARPVQREIIQEKTNLHPLTPPIIVDSNRPTVLEDPNIDKLQ